ncbi:hypothetical protein CVT26_003618 [Gymnopilus dilepis]|uniref:Ubiquitin 3 binding protein But2 C-terminal domain-containing protein n=1 Tax=Gymnopilus dilepis TaxID=231916 RepID=A0A409VR18_9AGAR|nr:hypothetical protein CVT26_003618 [Gymnopilus dilepis]
MDYQLLPVDDDGRRAKSQTVDESTGNSRLSWIALIVCLLCTFVNAFLTLRSTSVSPYTFPSATSFLTTRGMSRKDIDSLRRPSQFIGLDQIPLNSTTTVPRSFVNFPLLMAQANAERPYEVNKPQSGEWSPIGTVYPELGEMVVTSSISTFVQFRALDYGMERCELSIHIPAEEPSRPLLLPTSPIQIYNVTQSSRLYPESVSYAKRPKRDHLIGEPLLRRNSTWNYNFPCVMDELYTFEVACRDAERVHCETKWTQDKEHGSFPAILLIQYSST